MKSTEKIVDALTQLMEGFAELQEAIDEEYRTKKGDDDDDDDDDDDGPSEADVEVDAAIVTELRAGIEAVMDAEDYSPEEVASLVSSMTDALEEIDPNVFIAETEDANEDAGSTVYADIDETFDDDELFEDEDEAKDE